MNKQKDTFASLCHELAYRFDERTVFDDFLTMTLCSFSQNPLTGKSHDEDLYMETIGKYKDDPLRHNFPKMLSCLTLEMEERLQQKDCTDILGEFYEQNLSRKGASQYFTPWPVCTFMANAVCVQTEEEFPDHPLRILDPSCGSGRMLLAGSTTCGRQQEFYGIDIDHTCVKMAALNLFMNGIFHGEVMWADALNPDSFHMSYRLSFLPFGIFRIKERERSPLWNMHRNAFKKEPLPDPPPFREKNLVEKIADENGMSQLRLF